MSTMMFMVKESVSASQLAEKEREIEDVLCAPNVDLWRLRELALSEGGLVNDALRKRAWPKLVGLHDIWREDETEDKFGIHSKYGSTDDSHDVLEKKLSHTKPLVLPRSRQRKSDDDDDEMSYASHMSVQTTSTTKSGRLRVPPKVYPCVDAHQIDLDVARCTWHLLTGTQRIRRLQMEHKRHRKVAKLIRRKQRKLGNLINFTLVKTYPVTDPDKLRYYQGYHDVACIFLSVLGGTYQHSHMFSKGLATQGLEVPAAVLGQISLSHFRDCMRPNFKHLQIALRLTIFPLIAYFDPEVQEQLYNCDMEPFFALSWVITWFAHEIRDTDLVKRLFDAFLVSHPLFPIYLSVAMVCHPVNRTEILQTECDFALLHQTLTGLPKNSSMVGWKYRPGDGYVSDDEEDGTVSTDTMDSTSLEGDFMQIQTSLLENEDSQPPPPSASNDGQSLVTNSLSSVLEPPARVPFQVLIDTAIIYMRRVPPRDLLQLACRYYGRDSVEQILMEDAGEMTLLANPPSWTRAATAPADWVLKQQRQANPVRNHKRARSLSATTSLTALNSNDDDQLPTSHQNFANREQSEEVFKSKIETKAVIAAGFGAGIEGDRMQRKRRKIKMVTLASLLFVLAMATIRYSRRSSAQLSVAHNLTQKSVGNFTEGVKVNKQAEAITNTCVEGSNDVSELSAADVENPQDAQTSRSENLYDQESGELSDSNSDSTADNEYISSKSIVESQSQSQQYTTNPPLWFKAKDRTTTGLNKLSDSICSDGSACSNSIASLVKIIGVNQYCDASSVTGLASMPKSCAKSTADTSMTDNEQFTLPAWLSMISAVQIRAREQINKASSLSTDRVSSHDDVSWATVSTVAQLLLDQSRSELTKMTDIFENTRDSLHHANGVNLEGTVVDNGDKSSKDDLSDGNTNIINKWFRKRFSKHFVSTLDDASLQKYYASQELSEQDT